MLGLQDALISCTKATISISMKHNFHFGLYIKNVQSFKKKESDSKGRIVNAEAEDREMGAE